MLRCSIQLWFYEDSHPLAHRVIVPNVPNVAFHASYVGYLLHLYLCHKVAQVRVDECFWHNYPLPSVASHLSVVFETDIHWCLMISRYSEDPDMVWGLPTQYDGTMLELRDIL